MKRAILVFLSLLLIGCAGTKRVANTPSGFPEITYLENDKREVMSKLTNECMNVGMTIYKDSDRQIICGKNMEGMDAVLGQMAVGNSYSTNPLRKVRFSVVETNRGIRVQAVQWIESTTSFGQTNRQMLDQPKHFNALQNFLWRICQAEGENKCALNNVSKSAFKEGIQGKSYIGVFIENVDDGVEIRNVVKEGPAHKAGLRAGDVITALNNQKVESIEQFTNKIKNIPPGTGVSLLIKRNGEMNKFNVILESSE